MPVRDRYGRLTGEQRYLDAGVISPGALDISLGGDALHLRSRAWRRSAICSSLILAAGLSGLSPLFQEPLLVSIQ